uniref:ZFP64 zinc finger protein n=1 Tax=Sander lucioperca TaxID=283035 RepID=A0A8D0D201_SANLU
MATYSAEGQSVVVEVSPDIHICGFCKQQYNNFEIFLAHKQNGCSLATSDPPSTTATATLTEFVFEETYQTCVMRGVKKILTKAQKTPSKKLKPSLTSKRHSCCFSGWCLLIIFHKRTAYTHTLHGAASQNPHRYVTASHIDYLLLKPFRIRYGYKPFECELCHKRFSRRDKLNMHSRSHTGEKPHKWDAPFQCQLCDAKFKINSDLKRHIRIHSGEKPYKCDFCEYRCAMKGNLKSHIQLKHGTENSFCCEHCNFQCASKNGLRQHMREHQPIQAIQCSECTYSCASKGALKVHERIHSEERPFKCDFCNFASKQRSNLVFHKKKCHSDRPEKGSGGKGGRGSGGTSGGGDSPKPVASRFRAKLEAARAFCCDSCNASFVREDSLRSHKKQHRDTQNALQLQLSTPADAVSLVPTSQSSSTQLEVPVSADSMAPYSNAQLKIIVSHPLGQENRLIPAGVDSQHKTNMVLLSPENQDMVVNSMIQQVNLLAPMQALGSSQTAEGTLEPQTVLLTQLSPGDGNNPLHQALLGTAISAQDPSRGSQTFITTCSELGGLNALIQEGGTEVTVVTEGNAAMLTTATTPNMVCGPSEDMSKPAGTVMVVESALPCEESALLVPNISLGSQNVVIHAVPLIVSTQAQLSPHTLYSDTHTLEGIPQ